MRFSPTNYAYECPKLRMCIISYIISYHMPALLPLCRVNVHVNTQYTVQDFVVVLLSSCSGSNALN